MRDDLDYWDDIALDWSKKVQTSHNYRYLIIKPALKRLLSNIKNKKILDIGCGDGVLTEYLHELGADVTGIDGSRKMIEIAKQRTSSVTYKVMDARQKLNLDSQFDVITALLLLNSLSDLTVLFQEVQRLLKDEGFFLFVVLHPSFASVTSSFYNSWLRKIFGKPPAFLTYDYFQGQRFLRTDSKNKKQVPFYHRTLEQYSQALKNNSFLIEEILEPHELPEEFLKHNPKLEYTTKTPRFLIVKAVKK